MSRQREIVKMAIEMLHSKRFLTIGELIHLEALESLQNTLRIRASHAK